METHETPEQIQARRAMYAKFARSLAIAEKNRIREEPEPISPSDIYYETWRNKDSEKAWAERQMDYIHEYTEEYNTRPQASSSSKLSSSQSESADSKQGDVIGIRSKLNSLRGRGRKFLGASSSHESTALNGEQPTQTPHPPIAPSVCEFDRASTQMPPTEYPLTDYESNISTQDLRSTYFKDYKTTTNLPIYQHRTQIINSITCYNVVIIEGATGCGKTTQVPMYILEDAILENPSTKAPVIYVTQPRRIAARSIAERICNEHNWPMASVVGYQVSLEKQVGPHSVLVFCTAGVLLQKIIQEKSLSSYTHVIIDEAHERDADTDLLLMMIRKLMVTDVIPNFRLIVMSATMETVKLRNYFSYKTRSGTVQNTSPCFISVGQDKGPTNIQIVYLDRLHMSFGVNMAIPEFDMENPELYEDCLKAAVELITQVVPRLDNYNEKSKSTLVFLPGLAEISRLDRMIRAQPGAADFLDIIPLHSCLTVTDQIKVFKPARPGCRKVILATNIAESSITLTDVGFVVDFCLTKTIMKDNITRFPTLKLIWSTHDKSTQRAGRTGRCCPGKVFRMVPVNFYKAFRPFAEPELLTAPLELSVLRVKNFQMGEIKALFAIVLDPPPFNEVRTAVLELKQIGALAATYKGHLSDIDGDLTELGKIISALPIDVHLSKLIVVASVFDVLEDAIIVAACLSTNRTVVRYMYGNSINTYDIKLQWARGSHSDLFASLDCYRSFKELKDDRGKVDRWLASWCAKNHLDERKLHDVDSMVTEIIERLRNVNIFTGIDRPNRERDTNMDNLMLKIAFCAAFYPNYFLTDKLDAANVKRELCGLDPTKTVVMHGLPVNQVPLYMSQITTYLKDDVCDDLDFIADCSRALIVIKDEDEMNPEGMQKVADALEEDKYHVIQESRAVSKSVYKAIKIGEQNDLQVREYKEYAALERMAFYRNQLDDIRKLAEPRLVPSWMKVVDDRPADNSRLFEANDEEYLRITNESYYIEVDFNHDQDGRDGHELFELESRERDRRDENQIDHPVFKPTYKRVRGPDSPIRMSFRSVLTKSVGFKVEVDGQSVNSVLLDPEYEKDRRQMLVAAAVTQTKKGRVMARDTTLMPNIRGLPTLMALLFSQYYRLVYNVRTDAVAGAIFGIGWDADDKALDRMYEVILGFDVHITPDDIELINNARRLMSKLLKFTEIQNAGLPQAKMQADLRKIILTLMQRRRFPLSELDVSMIYYPTDDKDKLFERDVHNLQTDIIDDGETRPFLPLMKYTRQYQEIDMYKKIRDNLEQLKRIEADEESVPRGGIRCLLCGNGEKFCLILCSSLLTHMQSKDHLEKASEFESFEERAKQRNQK